MPTTLVSLVSEQTFINIIFIKEMPPADRYIFITTDIMEKKGVADWIIGVCNINYNIVSKISVDANSMEQIFERLNEYRLLAPEQNYVINLTGGNKIMSITVYEFFRNMNVKMYYKPIEHNGYLQCFPLVNSGIVPFNTCLNLKEYLNGYGIRIANPTRINHPLMTAEFTKNIFDNQLLDINHIHQLIKYKQEYERFPNKRLTSLSLNDPPKEVPGIAGFIKTTLGFPLENPNRLNEREIFYLIGGWFEEYIYHFVKQLYHLDNEHIGLNVLIEKNGVPNELDVVFVKDNDLHIIECKLKLTKLTFESALYKLVTVQRGTAYSLTSKAYIASSKSYRNRFGEFYKQSNDRAKLNKVTIIDPLNLDEL